MTPAARDEIPAESYEMPEIKPLEWSPVMLGRQRGGLDMGSGLYGYAPGFTDATDAGPFLVCYVHRSAFAMGDYDYGEGRGQKGWADTVERGDVIPPGRWRCYFQFGLPDAGHHDNREGGRGFATRAEAVAVAESFWKAAVSKWIGLSKF